RTNFQFEQSKNLLTKLPLFDLHVEFGDTIAPSPSKTVTKMTEDKSCDLKPSKMCVSFKYKPQSRSDFEESDLPGLAENINYEEKPKGENLKLSPTSLCFLKDKTEAEYAKPFNFLQSQPRKWCKRSSEPSFLCPILANQFNASKKEKVSTPFTDQNEKRAKKSIYSTDHSADSMKTGRKDHPLVKDSVTKENELTRDNQARTPCPAKKSTLLPLYFEDILNNPTIKIIDLGPKDTVLYSLDSETAPTKKDRADTPLDSLTFEA
ncbi:hypothetical protein STEG23_030064, partial [Scotinomys teguina]